MRHRLFILFFVLKEKFSFRYETFFKNDFSMIKEDKYICWYFIFHLIHAGYHKKAVTLLQDFSWLAFNILKVGPAHLIQDYYFVLKEAQSLQDKKVNINFFALCRCL